MRDQFSETTSEAPVSVWRAYHELLENARAARQHFLLGRFLSVGKQLRSRVCHQVHRLNIGLC